MFAPINGYFTPSPDTAKSAERALAKRFGPTASTYQFMALAPRVLRCSDMETGSYVDCDFSNRHRMKVIGEHDAMDSGTDPMGGEVCDKCNAELESGQIGLCDECRNEDGLECPACGNTDRIDIAATVWVRAFTGDEGMETDIDEARDGSHEFDDTTLCLCTACEHRATVGEFRGMPAPLAQAEPDDERDPMGGEVCDNCNAELESGQIGLCDECRHEDGLLGEFRGEPAPQAPAPVTPPALDARELGTVLAALRFWQSLHPMPLRALHSHDRPFIADIMTDGGKIEPLTVEEIDTLCDKINFPAPPAPAPVTPPTLAELGMTELAPGDMLPFVVSLNVNVTNKAALIAAAAPLAGTDMEDFADALRDYGIEHCLRLLLDPPDGSPDGCEIVDSSVE